ncbi:MAG: SCO family protein [Pseudomonadota bacterium]
MTKLYSIAAAGVLAVMLLGTFAFIQFSGSSHAANSCEAPQVAGATIGGPFELVNTESETVTDADVIDRPSLVYFGYTFCPDACPYDVARNVDAVEMLKEAGHDVRPVFISIDPERDTPEVMSEYQGYMHPDLVGLTGSPEQVKSAADAYRVYYNRGPSEDDEFYLVDHTTFTYLMLPGSEIATFFRREATAEAIADMTACLIS